MNFVAVSRLIRMLRGLVDAESHFHFHFRFHAVSVCTHREKFVILKYGKCIHSCYMCLKNIQYIPHLNSFVEFSQFLFPLG